MQETVRHTHCVDRCQTLPKGQYTVQVMYRAVNSAWSATTGGRGVSGGTLSPLPRPLVAAITAVDRLRRSWLSALGRPGRALVRKRELRVAVIFSVMVTTALIGSLVAPFWLLLLGPVVWGVPHVVADIRYLVVRSGYHQRPRVALLGGLTLLWMALGGPLVEGLLCTAAVALLARAGLIRRLVVAAVIVLFAFFLDGLGRYGNIAFAHLHNFTPLLLWWIWRRRVGKLHMIPLVLLVAATCFLLSPVALDVAQALGGLGRFSTEMGPKAQLWRLAADIDPAWGMRLVLLFCFSQSIHYGLWLHLLPDEDRDRATPLTFRATVEGLRVDLGDVGLVVAALLSIGVAVWALIDLVGANAGYFRMAQFHAHLEVMAIALFVLENCVVSPSGKGAHRQESRA